MVRERSVEIHSAEALAIELIALEDPTERRLARLSMRQDALQYRLDAKRYQSAARFADAIAKFGGGSLLTATALSYLNGQATPALASLALTTLLLFIAGTSGGAYMEHKFSMTEHRADVLDAVLKETER